MELKAIELFLQHPNLLSICRHVGVATVQLSHHLVDDEIRVTVDVKSLNPEFGSDV
jgi:hypothetical protein